MSGIEVKAKNAPRFAHVPKGVLTADVSLGARCLWALLATYAWHDGATARPSRATLATELHVDARSVSRWRAELEEARLLQVEERAGRASLYTIIYPSGATLDSGVKGHSSQGGLDTGVKGPLTETSPEEQQEEQQGEEHRAEVIEMVMVEPTRLARLLSSEAKLSRGVPSRSPQFNPTKTGVEAIERLHRIDGVAYEEIEAFIRWLYTADTDRATFWRKNILSGQKLRQQFFRVRDEAVQEARASDGGFLSYLSPEGRERFLGGVG